MRRDTNRRNRRSIRLRGYDYRWPGAYFVTICTDRRLCILEDDRIRQVVTRAWSRCASRGRIPESYDFVVMPNHVHGIVYINEPQLTRPATPVGTQRPTPGTASLRAQTTAFPSRLERGGAASAPRGVPALRVPSKSLSSMIRARSSRRRRFRSTGFARRPGWRCGRMGFTSASSGMRRRCTVSGSTSWITRLSGSRIRTIRITC